MFILFSNPQKTEFCKSTFLTDKLQQILLIAILLSEPQNNSFIEIYLLLSSLKFGNAGK